MALSSRTGVDDLADSRPSKPRRTREKSATVGPQRRVVKLAHKKRLSRLALQLPLAATFVLAWQYLPQIDWLAKRYKFLNKFFISSPTAVATRISHLTTGTDTNGITVWPYLKTTVFSSIEGVAIGLALGALAGLVFSNSPALSEVVRPFIILANAVPRIALIPIFVVIYGPTTRASIMSVLTVVFFLAFFNAFEGGRTIRPVVVDNAILLGANSRGVMRTIRLPQVVTWTFAVVPNAIAFGLVAATTTELITGIPGMGSLLAQALQNSDSTLTFSVVVVLSFVGLLLFFIATKLRDVVVRWDN